MLIYSNCFHQPELWSPLFLIHLTSIDHFFCCLTSCISSSIFVTTGLIRNITHTAVFEDIRILYKDDQHSVAKLALRLTSKGCWPSTLDRQNVYLALRIFDDSTAAALNVKHLSLHILLIHKQQNSSLLFVNCGSSLLILLTKIPLKRRFFNSTNLQMILGSVF